MSTLSEHIAQCEADVTDVKKVINDLKYAFECSKAYRDWKFATEKEDYKIEHMTYSIKLLKMLDLMRNDTDIHMIGADKLISDWKMHKTNSLVDQELTEELKHLVRTPGRLILLYTAYYSENEECTHLIYKFTEHYQTVTEVYTNLIDNGYTDQFLDCSGEDFDDCSDVKYCNRDKVDYKIVHAQDLINVLDEFDEDNINALFQIAIDVGICDWDTYRRCRDDEWVPHISKKVHVYKGYIKTYHIGHSYV